MNERNEAATLDTSAFDPEDFARASDVPEQDPKVTIKVGGVDFLKLAARKASGPTMFMTGKLKREGDVMLASRLTGFFRIPSAE
jgi:putative sterol carrier protein